MGHSSTEVLIARGSLREEMAGGDLGDARLNVRRNRLMTVLEQHPDKGFPAACASDGDTEALYRFLRNRRVSLAALMEPHLEATGARCRALDEVLMIHDTTEMSFPGAQQRRGLTQLGAQRHGFWVHTALAVSAEGLRAPLGLIAVAPFARPARSGPRPSWRKRFRDPRKESRRWAAGVTAVRSRLGEPGRAIHVMDREGDSYELLAALTAHGDRCVIRLHYDRHVVPAGAPEPTRLSEVRAHAAVIVEREVTVAPRRVEDRPQRLAHPARNGRVATVSFAACPVVLQRPRDHRASPLPATVAVNVVFGWEAQPPPRGDAGRVVAGHHRAHRHDRARPPDRGVVSHAVAHRRVFQVPQNRVRVRAATIGEPRHAAGRPGLAGADRVQLLLMRHLARELPETRATVALTGRQLAILRTTPAGAPLVATPSLRDALLVVARLGGHLRQNGEPGWLVLARGMQKLRDMEAGWAAAERARMM